MPRSRGVGQGGERAHGRAWEQNGWRMGIWDQEGGQGEPSGAKRLEGWEDWRRERSDGAAQRPGDGTGWEGGLGAWVGVRL